MFKPKALPQPELFVPSAQLVQPATSSFYSKLEQTLQSFAFATQVRGLCAAAPTRSFFPPAPIGPPPPPFLPPQMGRTLGIFFLSPPRPGFLAPPLFGQ